LEKEYIDGVRLIDYEVNEKDGKSLLPEVPSTSQKRVGEG
jgi:hypothetical protein